MISKMVQVLSTMIRPAAPSIRTLDLIKGNADNWGYNALTTPWTIIRLCDELLAELPEVPDWKGAFQVAVGWAKRNLPRFSQDMIDHAEALITLE